MIKAIATAILLASATTAFSQSRWITEDNFSKQKCPIDTVKGVLIWHDASKWQDGMMERSDSGYWVGRFCRTMHTVSPEGNFMYIPGISYATGKSQSISTGAYSKKVSTWKYDNGKGGSFYTKKNKKIPSSAVYALISTFESYVHSSSSIPIYIPSIDTRPGFGGGVVLDSIVPTKLKPF